MSLASWAKRVWSAAVSSQPRRVRASYDAAQTTRDNSVHWGQIDYLSADAANNAGVRRTLRARARYEAANNSYCRGIVETLANDTIGTGPRLQMLSDNPDANQRIEAQWQAWALSCRLAEKLRTMRMAVTVDGESFGLMATNPRLDHPVQLDVIVTEADQVTTPDYWGIDPYAVDGIRFDQWGNPLEYHRLRHHPGSDSTGTADWLDYDRIPAASMLHVQNIDRPWQHRGVPEITPALPLFAQLRRYTLAVIAAAETAADFAAVMYTDSPALVDPADVDALDEIELARRMMTTLPAGWKLGQIQAEQPTTSYREFVECILREVCRCLSMPMNVALGDSSNYNYASGRLDHQTYFKATRIFQHYLEQRVLDRLLAAWLDEALLIPGLFDGESMGVFSTRHRWFWDAHEHVDPEKEAGAAKTLLESGLLTEAEYQAKQGCDWEVVEQQRATELGFGDVAEYRVWKRQQLGGAPTPQPQEEEPVDADNA